MVANVEFCVLLKSFFYDMSNLNFCVLAWGEWADVQVSGFRFSGFRFSGYRF